MTNSPTSTEREEQLRSIRERAATYLTGSVYAEVYHADVNLLLSLLDDQAVGDGKFVGPCVSCGHNNYDIERGECRQRWMEGRYSVVCGCSCAKHNSLANAATAMRDKCVALLENAAPTLNAAVDSATIGPIMVNLIEKMESLTLDQQEKQQS